MKPVMNCTTDPKKIWLEIAVFDRWLNHTYGIPRTTKSLFIESLNTGKCGYFFYHPILQKFIVPSDLNYFIQLAGGLLTYDDSQLPNGEELSASFIAKENRVILTGMGWDYVGYDKSVVALHALSSPPMLASIIYDTIAINSPHFFEIAFAQSVANMQHTLFQQCDHFVCISKSTQRDVERQLQPGKSTSIIRLGEDIVPTDKPIQPTRDRYILCVGTLEIRKNHLLLYYVWRKLALRYGEACPRLVIVGRIGWLSGDVRDLITRDPLVNRFVDIRSGVPDNELLSLYTGCMFTVYPSFYEGYGLPVSESFRYGRVCASSNTSSLPEINPFPELMYDPYDFNAAYAVMCRLIDHPQILTDYEARIQANYAPQSCRNCFDELCYAIENT